jgi:hypothetical protein
MELENFVKLWNEWKNDKKQLIKEIVYKIEKLYTIDQMIKEEIEELF